MTLLYILNNIKVNSNGMAGEIWSKFLRNTNLTDEGLSLFLVLDLDLIAESEIKSRIVESTANNNYSLLFCLEFAVYQKYNGLKQIILEKDIRTLKEYFDICLALVEKWLSPAILQLKPAELYLSFVQRNKGMCPLVS
jgi:hypothetical protein